MTAFETSLLIAAETVSPEIIDLFAQAQGRTLPALRSIENYQLRRSMGPLMLRAHLCELLADRKTLDTPSWSVKTDPLRMASIRFFNEDLQASFRLLKERNTYPGAIPTAVAGTKRSADWNPALFGEESSHRLLCTFDIYRIESHEHWETPLRFIRALAAPQFGKPVPYDLSIPLIAEPGFYAGRSFETRDDEDLFAFASADENEVSSNQV